jgi:hypothetical protein
LEQLFLILLLAYISHDAMVMVMTQWLCSYIANLTNELLLLFLLILIFTSSSYILHFLHHLFLLLLLIFLLLLLLLASL